MKKNSLFDQCVANVAPAVMEEVSLNVDIANRICDLLKEKNMTQRELATLMGKRESEISRWLSGSHGFTTTTLAKIAAVLGEPIVMVKREPQVQFVFVPIQGFITPSEQFDEIYTNNEKSDCFISYPN